MYQQPNLNTLLRTLVMSAVFFLNSPFTSAQCPASANYSFSFEEEIGLSSNSSDGNTSISLSVITWIDGVIGNALDFDGSQSKANFSATQANWSDNSDFSIEFWVNQQSINPSNNMVFIGRDDHSLPVHWWIGAASGSGELRVYFRDDQNNLISINSSNTLTLDQWYYISLTYSDAENKIRLYLDGQQIDSTDTDFTGNFESTEDITLGFMNFNGSDNFFSNISVDELLIHDELLSKSTVQQHYASTLAGDVICPNSVPPVNIPIKILPLGNSITYDNYSGDVRPQGDRTGYRFPLYEKLTDAGYNFDLIGSEVGGQNFFNDSENAGFPGISSQQMITLLETGYNGRTRIQVTDGPYLNYYQPNVVLLHLGTNGVTEDVTATNTVLDILENYASASGTDLKILVARIINRSGYSAVTSTYNRNLEASIITRGNPNIYIIDMEDGAGINYSSDMIDDLHPNSLGYSKMADLWFSNLTHILTPPNNSLIQAPSNLKTEFINDRVIISWNDNSSNETSFDLLRSTEPGSGYSILQTLPANTSSYEDLSIAPNTQFYYKVQASNNTTNSAFSNISIENIPEIDLFENLALNKTAMQSSTAYGGIASRAVDGNTDGNWSNGSVTHTTNSDNPWWEVDLGGVYNINNIEVWNRTNSCCISRMANFYVFVSDVPFSSTDLNTTINQSGVWSRNYTNYPNPMTSVITNNSGRYVRIQLQAASSELTLAEVVVNGSSGPPPAPTAPSAPNNLTTNLLSTTSVTLNWQDNSNNEDGFIISRKINSEAYTVVDTINQNTTVFADTGLTHGINYTYRVQAFNTVGNSGFSNESIATIPTPTAPAAPSTLSANAISSTQINLSWTDNANNEDGFTIERRLGAGSFVELTAVAAGTESFTDLNLTPSTNYTYRVFASNAVGNSAYSNEANTQTTSNDVIENLALNKSATQSGTAYGGVASRAVDGDTDGSWGNGSVTHTTINEHSWWEVDLGDVYNINDIEIWNRTDYCCINRLSIFWVFVSDVPFNSTELSTTINQEGVWGEFIGQYPNPMSSLTVNQSGRYVRIQLQPSGELAIAEVVVNGSSGPPPAPTFPLAPNNLTSNILSTTSVALNWQDNSNNEDGFIISRKINDGTFTSVDTVNENTNSFTDNELTHSINYTYRVQAYNTVGNSNYSNESVATIPTPTAPAAPSELAANAISSTQISLSWTDNASNEDGVIISRKINSEAYTVVDTINQNTTVFADTGLTHGINYTYRVQAFNTVGNSGFSNESIATIPTPTAPAAPSTLSANAISSTQINLSWTDNANNEDGFTIERRLGAGSFVELTAVAAGTESFTDLNLTPSTNYTYRVFASNAVGNSAYSNEANTQTTSNDVIENLALNKSATQSGTAYGGVASRAVDGDTDGSWGNGSVTHTTINEHSWWEVDLGDVYNIDDIEIWNRTDNCCISRLSHFWVFVSDVPFNSTDLAATANQGGVWDMIINQYPNPMTSLPVNRSGRYIRIQLQPSGELALAEVVVNGSSGPPPAPTVPLAPNNLNSNILSTTSVALNWQDNSNNEDGFIISRKINSEEYMVVDTINQNIAVFTDTGLTHGINYTYRVQAYNTVGNSGYSNESVATIPTPTAPDAPSALSANAISSTQINLSWTDNASNEDEFTIERRPDAGSFEELTTVAAGTESFTDINLTPSTNYTYRVFASNAVGNSAYSNEANAQTTSNDIIVNLALNKSAMQSSTAYGGVASRAVDGNTDGNWSNNSVTHTTNSNNPWWEVDLGGVYNINDIEVWNRTNSCCRNRMANFWVFVSETPFNSTDLNSTISQSGVCSEFNSDFPNPMTSMTTNRSGRYIRVQLDNSGGELTLAEVVVNGVDSKLKSAPAINSITNINSDNFKLYPNPANSILNIEYKVHERSQTTLALYDMNGKEIVRLLDRIDDVGNYNFTWNSFESGTGKIPNGIYFMRVTINNTSQYKKVIIQ